jgi:hypothetical protein
LFKEHAKKRYVGEPYFAAVKSKSGKSTRIRWNEGTLTETGTDVLREFISRSYMNDRLRHLVSGECASVSLDDTSGSLEQCPNDLVEEVERIVKEVHALAVQYIKDKLT